MRRPLIWAFGASILGEILVRAFGIMGLVAAGAVALTAILVVRLERLQRRKSRTNGGSDGYAMGVILASAFLICGAGRYLACQMPTRLETLIEEAETGKLSVCCEGFVVSWSETEYGYAAECLIDARTRILWYGEGAAMSVGDRVRIEGEVSFFTEATNPGQSDMRAYYRARGIAARGRIRSWKLVQKAQFPLTAFLEAMRQRLSERLYVLCEGAGVRLEDARILQAVLLGLRSEVSEEDRDLFALCGISHILSISGMHISLLGRSIYRFLRKRMTIPVMTAGVLAGAFILAYGRTVSTGPASVRALVMFLSFLQSQEKGEYYDSASAAALSGIGILLETPALLFEMGFQLTFLTAGAIGLIWPTLRLWVCGQYDPAHRTPFREALAFSLLMQYTTLPTLLWFRYVYPTYGFLVNLLAVWAVGGLIASGFVGIGLSVFAMAAGEAIVLPAGWILLWYRILGEVVRELPACRLITGQPLAWRMILGLGIWGAGLAWIIRGKGRSRQGRAGDEEVPWQKGMVRLCLMALMFAATIGFWHRSAPRQLEICVLDVGQGDGILIRTPADGTFLIDGGSSDVKDVGEKRIEPCLLYYGVGRIDACLLSHLDSDHTSGASWLVESGFPIDRVLISSACTAAEKREELLRICMAAGIPVGEISAGDTFDGRQVHLACLWPDAGSVLLDENDASEVLLLRCGDFRMLFTGDLGGESEKQILESASLPGPVQVLKVAHHGSRGSTSEEWLKSLSPEAAVISCSARNTYGHPHPETLDLLSGHGCETWVTAAEGAICICTNGAKWDIMSFKSEKQEVWYK